MGEVRSGINGTQQMLFENYIYTKVCDGARSVRWRCLNKTKFACKAEMTSDLETNTSMRHVMLVALFVLVYILKFSTSVTCPPECICLSQSQVLCNTGGLTEIPLKMLPPTVEHLSLTKNHFPVIRSDAFTGLRHLRKLSLDGNNITTIKPFAFRGLPRLRELSIQHTPLTTVAQFAFAGLQNITAILLGHNKIQKVEGYAFAGTSNVRLLLLNNNPIQKVETSAFSGLTNVEHLLLPSGIKTLEADAFSGLDSVGLIKLPFMDLQALKPFTFRGLSHVHVLAIQESDLGTIKAGAFDGLNHIGSLNIYNNKIDSIQEFHIRPINKVKIIRFHGNHLLDSPKAGAISIQGVETLSVTANHFPCDCHIHSLLDGPFGNSTTGDFRTKNFCISPLDVNGKAIAELDVDSIARCQEEVTRGNWDAPSRATSLPTLVSVCLAVVACGVS